MNYDSVKVFEKNVTTNEICVYEGLLAKFFMSLIFHPWFKLWLPFPFLATLFKKL